MKVGFIMAFNEIDWVGYAIDQAAKICDRVIVCEGSQFASFPHIPERSDDGTLDVIQDKKKEYSDLITVQNTARSHPNYRQNQCINFNTALNSCNKGDYFIPLDVDEYYRDSFLVEINALMSEGKVDHVHAKGYAYGFSFKWRIAGMWSKDVLFKVVDGFKFIPTHKPSSPGTNRVINTEENIFHYTWLKPKSRMRIRMETSNFHPGMLKWFDNNWDKIELINNKSQLSYKGTHFTLEQYEGDHPSVLDNHPWRHVEDIRKI